MVKLNKKKGRRSGKHIQYNLARKSLKKKSKKNNKSKKLLIGGFMSKKTNQYDNGATISFNITNTCGDETQTQTQTLTFRSQDNIRDLTNDDDKKNFVLLKHRVLDEKPLTTSSFKTPLYAAYFKIPKIIFSLCKQKSKGDKNELLNEWGRRGETSKDKWEILSQFIDKRISERTAQKKSTSNKNGSINLRAYKRLKHLKDEITLMFLYPRLDAHVSTDIGHLLKSPFAIHPKTGKVCVPFKTEDLSTFDPFAAPALKDLVNDYNLG